MFQLKKIYSKNWWGHRVVSTFSFFSKFLQDFFFHFFFTLKASDLHLKSSRFDGRLASECECVCVWEREREREKEKERERDGETERRRERERERERDGERERSGCVCFSLWACVSVRCLEHSGRSDGNTHAWLKYMRNTVTIDLKIH